MKPVKNFRTLALVLALVGVVSAIPASGLAGSTRIFAAQKNSASLQKAAKVDLSGKWDLNVTTDGGPISAKMDLKVAADGSITGSVDSAEYGSSAISGGSVTDASFVIKFNISGDGNAIQVVMNGTFDEKSMKGSGSAGDAGFSFTGTRSSSAQN
jgi:hypothetical protein